MKEKETTLKKDEILLIVGQFKNKFEQHYGVTKMGVFGSVAKGQNRPGSDVDVFVEMTKPDMFYLVHIKEELESALGSKVDVIHLRKNMNKFLQERIQQEAVYV